MDTEKDQQQHSGAAQVGMGLSPTSTVGQKGPVLLSNGLDDANVRRVAPK
jgi:hypothetical protein